jgi:hypothetical protein
MRAQLHFMANCVADFGDCCGVCRSVYFSSHPRTPVEKRISRIASGPAQ